MYRKIRCRWRCPAFLLPVCGTEPAGRARAGAAVRAGAGSPRRNPCDRRRLRVCRSAAPAFGSGRRVTNPNPFSLTLGTLKGTLFLEDSRAADVDFPLGLPLAAGGDTTVPIDLTVSFANLPGLADSIRRAVSRQPLAYRLEGTIGVDAGRLGQPTFGPMTLLRGDVAAAA